MAHFAAERSALENSLCLGILREVLLLRDNPLALTAYVSQELSDLSKCRYSNLACRDKAFDKGGINRMTG